MEHPLNTSADRPGYRVCLRCGVEKEWTLPNWPERQGQPVGRVCRPCSTARKRAFDRTYKAREAAASAPNLAELTAANPPTPAEVEIAPQPKPTKKGGVAVSKLEAARALQMGAIALTDHARTVLERVFRYAHDPNSPHHEWAMKLVVDRLLPRKLYEDLGGQAAGIKPGANTPRPAVYISVNAAEPGGTPRVVTIEGESSEERDDDRSDN